MRSNNEILDVVLVGGGIMSTTLGALLCKVLPGRSVALFERLECPANESSGPWNNAGTGHAGLCELNYMPDPNDSSKTQEIARQFRLTRAFWNHLIDSGELPPSVVNSVPHMNVVFGDSDVAYLRRRWETLRNIPDFCAMEYSEDPEVIRHWAPLLMDRRADTTCVAATRADSGTDVDFGAVSRALATAMAQNGCVIRTGHEVTGIRRGGDGIWTVSGRERRSRRRFTVRTRFVFVGAGGYALRLLQKAKIPEVHGYGVFPFGAEFLRCDVPAVVSCHHAKVYGKPSLGAPPMSLPHLDTRLVNGEASLMFGPYATFSTRLLKRGSLRDLFTTIRPRNLPVLVSVALQNMPLLRYLLRQLVASRAAKFAELRSFYPDAHPADWYPIAAGQRAQLVKPTSRLSGTLMFGTEVVTGADGTIAGLLGASPGASVAPSAMIEVLAACFATDRKEWEPRMRALLPGCIAPVS